MKRFEDRVAVVTGAASGIGRALARDLAARGAHLALVDVNEAGLDALASELDRSSRRVTRHVVDVSRRERMEHLAQEVVAAHGGVHLLVNNAGVALAGDVGEQTLDDVEWLVGINFWGVYHGCHFFLPHLRRAPEAHIVNLSSIFGVIGVPTQSAYCAAKFAVRGLSETLAGELRGTSIGVTSVHPGGVRTDIVRSARGIADGEEREQASAAFERLGWSPEYVSRRVLRAVERRRARLVVCPEAVALDWLKRLAPTTTQRFIAWGASRRQTAII